MHEEKGHDVLWGKDIDEYIVNWDMGYNINEYR